MTRLKNRLAEIKDEIDVAVKVVVADEILTVTFSEVKIENECAFLFLDEIIEVEE